MRRFYIYYIPACGSLHLQQVFFANRMKIYIGSWLMSACVCVCVVCWLQERCRYAEPNTINNKRPARMKENNVTCIYQHRQRFCRAVELAWTCKSQIETSVFTRYNIYTNTEYTGKFRSPSLASSTTHKHTLAHIILVHGKCFEFQTACVLFCTNRYCVYMWTRERVKRPKQTSSILSVADTHTHTPEKHKSKELSNDGKKERNIRNSFHYSTMRTDMANRNK